VSRYFAVNSSPLILLGRISRIDLLPALLIEAALNEVGETWMG